MGTVLNSLDNVIAQAAAQGTWRRNLFALQNSGTTVATVNSGGNSGYRFANSWTVPTFGGSVTAAYCTYFRAFFGSTSYCAILAYEQVLGSLTVSGNVFASGTAMPTRTIEGVSTVTATLMPVLVVTATLTATTPVVTITYTNESGTGSRTATLTLPSSAALNSCFQIAPHLQSGDTGIRSVQNISISTGSAGSLRVNGLFPLGIVVSGAASGNSAFDFLSSPFPMFPLATSDVMAIYQIGTTTAGTVFASVCLVGDN